MKRAISGRPHIYHGWYVVAVCMIVSIVTTCGAFGVFVIPMIEDFGWSRATISIAASAGFLFHGLMQPLFGKALDRFGGRWVILVSLTIFGLATAALGLALHSLFVIFIFGVISGTAFSGTYPGNTGALIAKFAVNGQPQRASTEQV